MLNTLRIRILIIVALVALSGWVLRTRGITLGLDLQGGTHFALEVRDPTGALGAEQREDAIDRALTVIRSRIDELGVAEPVIQKSGTERIVIELPGAGSEEQQRARAVIERPALLTFQIVRPRTEIDQAFPRLDRAARSVSAGVEAPSGGTAQVGPATPPVERFGVRVDSTAESADAPDDPSVAASAGSPLSTRLLPYGAAEEGIYLVAEDDAPVVEGYLATAEVRQALPRGIELRWGAPERRLADGYETLYVLADEPLVTGEPLVDAQAQRDPQTGQPMVAFEFSREGGRAFQRGTSQNVGNLMAIVLDERVMSAAVIREAIGAQGRIELIGRSIEEARDLSLVLRAGALPVPLDIVEQRSIGPSLGQDSIDRGQIAGIIALAVVVAIMVGYYRFSGVLSVLALALYVLFLLGGLAAIGRALTLPGIAGLILSIGMAVDANVLIFERIREELANDQTPRRAVDAGFRNALSAIVDAQITTLLTALVLYQFGTSAVRGFALTLGIGIAASMFTAIYVTRTFFMVYLDRGGGKRSISI